MEKDKDMWKKLFEDCTKKQGQEIKCLRQEYKERSERLDDGSGKSDTCKECSSWAVPDGTPDASRTNSEDEGATSDYDRMSDNPGPK